MSKRPARFTETETRRILRAAKREGFGRVEMIPSPEGLKIVCELQHDKEPEPEVEAFK